MIIAFDKSTETIEHFFTLKEACRIMEDWSYSYLCTRKLDQCQPIEYKGYYIYKIRHTHIPKTQ